MTQVLKTKDYEMFNKHESNRKINQPNLKKIIHSIKTQNMLQFRPILVDGNMNVIDGQHRLEAAKELQVEVYYQVKKEAEHEDIVLLNSNQRAWSYDDYFNYYISRGNEDYKKIKQYCEKNNISINEFIHCTFSGPQKSKEIKTGLLKFPDSEKLNELNRLTKEVKEILEVINKYLLNKKTLTSSQKLKRALYSFLRNPEVKSDTLIDKITMKASAIRPCADTFSYYSMLKDIYNWRNPSPVV